MVTSNKSLENKAVTMSDNSASNAGPPRTLLDEVNPHLTCVLCHGYYIDATTIVECLHSFCRSCIIKHLQTKSYCPVCEMMINSARPNIKPDKALQDIVYKLVPGLFQKEMERRQQFYASHPGPAASATPEQRGEDTERIIFSPEDVISFSLEYIDSTETDSASSKSSESGNDNANSAGSVTRRYLQCPAVVNISHLKKFLSMKFDIDLSQFGIDILYKRLPLPDYYTLIDVAYIYNWKRIDPMRFFYQVIDFSAIRNRFGLFGINRHSLIRKRKRPAVLDLNSGTSLHGLLDPSSDGSSGANSPLPEDSVPPPVVEKTQTEHENNQAKNICEGRLRSSKILESEKCTPSSAGPKPSGQSPPPDEEKSQFLNSFELTAKNKLSPSPVKSVSSPSASAETPQSGVVTDSVKSESSKDEVAAKRKINLDNETPADTKKIKVEENRPSPVKKDVKCEHSNLSKTEVNSHISRANLSPKKNNEIDPPNKIQTLLLPKSPQSAAPTKELETKQCSPKTLIKYPPKKVNVDDNFKNNTNNASNSLKRPMPSSIKLSQSPVKRKLSVDPNSIQIQQMLPKPQNVQLKKPVGESSSATNPTEKKMESKLIPNYPEAHAKVEAASNKSSLKSGTLKIPTDQNQEIKQTLKSTPTTQSSCDPLKSLIDSCKINIPSSLSITLTDQKFEQKPGENISVPLDHKKQPHKAVISAMASNFNNPAKTPSPPVHNYIEILKLPEVDATKKTNRNDSPKSNISTKSNDSPVSAKGPVPNLKPISETKNSKSVTFTKPQTFQQTFLQSLQKQQQTEKTKIIKNKLSAPKVAGSQPGKPTEIEQPSANGNYINQNPSKSGPSNASSVADKIKTLPSLVKTDSALDLSTPHQPQNPLALQQTKALETMQSIANLAKKQNYSQKGSLQSHQSPGYIQSNLKNTNQSHLRIPVPANQTKQTVVGLPALSNATGSPRHVAEYFQPLKTAAALGSNSSPKPTMANQNTSTQPLRVQTRSPSSSPKLVIACPSPKSQSPEEKQLVSPNISDNSNQSNQISSSQISSTNTSSGEASSSKEAPKVPKQPGPVNIPKLSNVRLPSQKMPTAAASPTDILHHLPPQVLAQQAYIRQLELQNQFGLFNPGTAAQWFQLNSSPMARTHFENIMKSISHNAQNPFNSHHKDGKS